MSNNTQLGKLASRNDVRDAIHIAIAPVKAGEQLLPGAHVGFVSAGVVKHNASKLIGIVDPFLDAEAVEKGEMFWMLLYPNTITSLRHDWSHPSFHSTLPAGAPEMSSSEIWLREYAESNGLTFEEILEAAESYINYGDYLCQGGRFEGCYVPDEFWNHYEAVAHVTVHENNRGSFFSCSC